MMHQKHGHELNKRWFSTNGVIHLKLWNKKGYPHNGQPFLFHIQKTTFEFPELIPQPLAHAEKATLND
jgi:hypothetical protein